MQLIRAEQFRARLALGTQRQVVGLDVSEMQFRMLHRVIFYQGIQFQFLLSCCFQREGVGLQEMKKMVVSGNLAWTVTTKFV